eukprot:g7850.t1
MSTVGTPLLQHDAASNVQPASNGYVRLFRRLPRASPVSLEVIVDWLCFLYRWLFSALCFGTVLCIKNESNEALTLYIKTKFSDATGFGDWTWHLYKKGWTYVPEKAKYWRITPQRRTSFMLPFCTCLIVLGTEANFTYFLVHDARAPGERFATIWTTCHTFIPRFVRVSRDLEVITKLRYGQANASKPNMQSAFKSSGLFKAVPDLTVLPRVMLPPGSRVVIGPSLEVPEIEQADDEESSGSRYYGLASKVTDLVNEGTVLLELFYIEKLHRLVFGIFLFLQIQIWNSYKNLHSPFPQGKYGEDGFWLSWDYDASLAFILQALPGGLQAIMVLIVARPESGAQLFTVLLAFANLVMILTAACSSASEEVLQRVNLPGLSRRTKYINFFTLFILLLALPAYLLCGYVYYYQSGQTMDYIIIGITTFALQFNQVFNLQKIDGSLKGITPALAFGMIKRAMAAIGRFISKFRVESFVVFLVIVSVLLNAFVLFVIKERSL